MNQESILYNVTQIPAGHYEGYIWKSDDTHPKVILPNCQNDAIILKEGINPFIIEGQLYDRENGLSYSIKFVDGHYVAIRYNLADLHEAKGVVVESKKFLSNRLKDVTVLLFQEFWHPVTDPLCAGMEVLQPRELVFVGFEYKTQE